MLIEIEHGLGLKYVIIKIYTKIVFFVHCLWLSWMLLKIEMKIKGDKIRTERIYLFILSYLFIFH